MVWSCFSLSHCPCQALALGLHAWHIYEYYYIVIEWDSQQNVCLQPRQFPGIGRQFA